MATSQLPGFISFIVGLILLGVKFTAYLLTGSQAVFSDALESIVNVIAAGVAYFLIYYGARPADENHPYGHGKTEFFSASFEGGLISFAAVAIAIRAIYALVTFHTLGEINLGLALTGGASIANLTLGLYLLRQSKLQGSSALAASGHHVISDFWTSVASVAGLTLVKFTGIVSIDPIVALLMGIYLGRTGYKIVRKSVGGLLDEEDQEILSELMKTFNAVQDPGIIKIHHTRVMRSGDYQYIDAHVIAPEFWDILQAHDKVNAFERRLIQAHTRQGEIHFHIDPCRRAHCSQCDYPNCPVRVEQFEKRKEYTIASITARKASR